MERQIDLSFLCDVLRVSPVLFLREHLHESSMVCGLFHGVLQKNHLDCLNNLFLDQWHNPSGNFNDLLHDRKNEHVDNPTCDACGI